MNFLALLLGLGIERALTHFFHLREFRWLDPLFDFVFRRLGTASRSRAIGELALVALLLVLPVAWTSVALAGQLFQIPAVVFAVVVLLFSLGPRDLQEEVAEYCAACESGNNDDVARLARELAEQFPPAGDAARERLVGRAIFVQANNRIFGVVFWFLVLGPAGAWLFRVVDLMRRRAVYANPGGDVLPAARILQGILAWLPARLMSAAFALAGSFDGAISAWRAGPKDTADTFFERTEDLVDRVGSGASAGMPPDAASPPTRTSRAAMALARRTLWLIWYPVIAFLTLNDWLR